MVQREDDQGVGEVEEEEKADAGAAEGGGGPEQLHGPEEGRRVTVEERM